MKKFLVVLFCSLFLIDVASAQYVSGYYRSDGTYVNGYHRTNANNTQMDNYSTKGNINPYTGAVGTRNPNSYNNSGSRDSYSYRNSGFNTRRGFNGMY